LNLRGDQVDRVQLSSDRFTALGAYFRVSGISVVKVNLLIRKLE